jgi:hypothetical protein
MASDKRRIATFTVRSRGQFTRFPLDSRDVMQIEAANAENPIGATRVIRLNCAAHSGPTIGRWASFGWTVVEGDPR